MQYFFTGKLQAFAQQTVYIINSVINMDVTIVDEKIRRIAGTGIYANNIYKHLPAGYVFERVINFKEICFIKEPGKTKYCEGCLERDICKEKATLLVPIKIGEDVIGGMALIAMTDREKTKLINNLENYTNFLVRMADLISTKVENELKSDENLMLSNNLNTIIESYPYGIMSIDCYGVVMEFNRNAELILNISANSILKKQYTEKLSCELIEKAISGGASYQTVKAVFKINKSSNKELILSIQPIVQNEKLQKIICFFQNNKKSKKINKIVENNVKYSFNNIHGQSIELNHVKELIKKISNSNSTVLITGESGTGKELFAKAIHYESNRSTEQFIAINCSAIPDNLLESELFGYSKGAFTSANYNGKMGKFELANKGTIFLDEIGDMPLNLQAKLLRVLQERKIERLGDTKTIDIDIRVLAATNKDLKMLISEKLFREDLYYRLNVIPVHIPTLRERKNDISILSKYFLEKYSELLLKDIKGFLPDTLFILNNYSWPGNVRELENAIEYAVNMEITEFIKTSSLPPDIVNFRENKVLYTSTYQNNLHEAIDEIEKNSLKELLAIYGDSTESKKIIANKLDISLSTLYRKLKRIEEHTYKKY
ncbi:MAG: signal-transduction and transcriptional-controlprotein [Bacillota bacterium]|jgi:transcriptional regulator with PAS, ATPase and Fis domain|nr:signal-transduction and transcriptional-controlprotein [Bacillota bacterium]